MADLIFGAKNGLLDNVKQQLRFGVDVNYRDQKDGATALYWAACSGHASVISVLLDAAADVNVTVKWGSTALHAAADRGHTECMKLLLEHNADPNIQNQNGDAPLHLAAYRGYEKACLILLEFNVDVTIPNKGGKNAQQEAQAGQHFELAKILEEKSRGRLAASYPQYQPNRKTAVGRLPSTGYSNSDQEFKMAANFNITPNIMGNSVGFGNLPMRTDPVFGDTRDLLPAVPSRNMPVQKTFSAPPSPSEKITTSNKQREGGSPGSYMYAMQMTNQEAKGIIDDLQLKLAMAESEKDALKSKIANVAEKRYFEDSSLSLTTMESNSLQRVKNELSLTKQALSKSEQKNKQLENALAKKSNIQNPLNNLSASPGDNSQTPHNIASAAKSADFGLQLIKAISGIGKMFSSRDTNLFPIMSSSLEDMSSVTLQLYQTKLLDRLKSGKISLKKWRNCKLDRPGQVWTMGHQYKIVKKGQFSKTVNILLTRHTSVAFEILHHDKKYIMKVMPNEPDVQNIHFPGRNADYRSFNPVRNEQEVLLRLPPHSNLVSVLHHYEIPLRKLDSNFSHIRDQKTTIAIMPEYLMTLCKLMGVQQQNLSVPYALSENFFQQVLLQILKALAHLQDNSIAHRDIKPDCVYITESLQVVLGGFRMAMKLTGPSGQPIQFSKSCQIGAGNPWAWTPELKKWEKDGPPKSWERKVFLTQVYESTDIYNLGRMVFTLMKHERPEPQSTPNMIAHCGMTDWRVVPAGYSKPFTDLLQEMFAKDPQDRPTVKEAILRTSMMLYGPKIDEVQSQQDCDLWVVSQCSRLVAQMPDLRDRDCSNMATEELAHALDWELCTDYLTEVSNNELWQLICSLHRRSGHRKEMNT
ncbi:uncharacterized protein LOC117120918 [Anneissia japonica]|uniref:uncharacterized protein LOC117120918 n=1 Tax=Anneissia japonica TaxID=1529436 RepID=UPI0014257A4E|nr:uncharacterized protein LOC117120918 [Anneissia japonica]XP_033121908.1 uncharacterized protein LOC117120918 [Anneissia japonica]XP_033121909.1 uncharacterized protein LOC117120918 [Anneissia japonica]XP_033121910.1 uncharacterized protein LOC117120918 [Anneissia japonica]XP_033121911.1 uncharacterized protein LOC117120918 [Anneissia japonica]